MWYFCRDIFFFSPISYYLFSYSVSNIVHRHAIVKLLQNVAQSFWICVEISNKGDMKMSNIIVLLLLLKFTVTPFYLPDIEKKNMNQWIWGQLYGTVTKFWASHLRDDNITISRFTAWADLHSDFLMYLLRWQFPFL